MATGARAREDSGRAWSGGAQLTPVAPGHRGLRSSSRLKIGVSELTFSITPEFYAKRVLDFGFGVEDSSQ